MAEKRWSDIVTPKGYADFIVALGGERARRIAMDDLNDAILGDTGDGEAMAFLRSTLLELEKMEAEALKQTEIIRAWKPGTKSRRSALC